MVSRYLVDEIVIAGVVAGALGVLYLSQGLFRPVASSWLRRLIIALPFAGIYFIRGKSTLGLFGGLIMSIFGFIGVFFLFADEKSARLSLRAIGIERREDLKYSIPTLAVLMPILALGMNIVLFRLPFQTALVLSGLFLIVGLPTLIGGPWLMIKASRLTDRQLQIIGLIFTLTGIATQFVSPVLDLLNIKVG